MKGKNPGAWILLAALSVSCGESTTLRDEPIRIGVVVSLSGELMSVGDHLVSAARLAAREINSAGGVLGGRQIELVIRDDRTDAAAAATVAQELLDEGVVAIVGGLASSSTQAIQALTRAAEVPQISCCSTSRTLTEIQPPEERFLFRTAPSDTIQARVLVRVVESNLCQRLAILHADDPYGQPFSEGIVDALQGSDVAIVTTVPFLSGRSNYATEADLVASANPDCVALVAFPDDGGAILRAWNELGTPPPVLWIGTDGIKDQGFVRAAGSESYVDGVIGTAPIVVPSTPSANAFGAAYQLAFGEGPGIFAGNQYDAVILVALAIQAAGSTDGRAIRDALFDVATERDDGLEDTVESGQMAEALSLLQMDGVDIDYEGASGPVNFDANGDVTTDYELWRYDAGSGFVRTDTISEAQLDP